MQKDDPPTSCPSFVEPGSQPNRERYNLYAGIEGAVDMVSYNEPRVFSYAQGAGTTKTSGGGMLGVNYCCMFSDVTDGLSNTRMFGEQGGMLIRLDGTHSYIMASQGASAQGASNYTGWLIATREAGQMPFPDPTCGTSGNNGGCAADHRYFNVTTVRYRIYQAPFADTVFPGMSSSMGGNNPLISFHVGGIQCTLGNGAVRFLSENMDIETLKKLATRDDGQAIGEF